MKVAAVGDNCMDVYNRLGRAFPGGNPVNVAVYLKRMQAEASYIGVVGNDAYGELMLEAIKSKGVDVTHLHKKEGKTAVTEVELINNDRVFGDYTEGVLEDFKLEEEDISFILEHRIVHSGIWGRVEGNFRRFKESGLITCFDFSDKLDSDLIDKAVPHTDYAFFSYDQDDSFIEAYLRRIHSMGPRAVVATLGEKGSIAFDGSGYHRMEVLPVKAVDTMGAGDSYIAGFIYGISKGLDIRSCMSLGTQQAAETITYFGAW